MATAAVLRPSDSLIGRNPNPICHHRRPKRSHGKSPATPLVIGHVKILKRGEILQNQPPATSPVTSPATVTTTSPATVTTTSPATVTATSSSMVTATSLSTVMAISLVTSPATVTATFSGDGYGYGEEIVVYAGSAVFMASPPPSSVPFPEFCRKKEENSFAASDIRRMLGIDLDSIIR